MSQALAIQFWWNSPVTFAHIQKTLAVFEDYLGIEVQWTRCTMERSVPSPDGLSLNSPVTTHQLMDWVVDDMTHYRVTMQSQMPCWRFTGHIAERAFVPIAFSFWGKEFGKTIGFDQAQAGHGQLSILQSSPYFGTVDAKATEAQAQLRYDRVEDNLKALLDLLMQLTTRTKPTKWLAYNSDAAPKVAIHASAGWFANSDVILDSVAETLEMLRLGRPKDRLPAVANLDGVQGTGYQHPYRSATDAQTLLLGLQAAAAHGLAPNAAHLQQVIDRDMIDLIPLGIGHIFLDYPFFLNSFLDGFILEAIPLEPTA
jgi:hypothetical protein